MKTTIISAIVLILSNAVIAQNQAETYINEAKEFLVKKEYKQAQLSLQDAINELNTLIAAQIAESIPNEIGALKSTNNNGGSTGMFGGGFQISKSYENAASPWNTAEINIMANSPLLATLGMYMSNPSMLGPEYKSVRIGTERAIFKSEMEDYSDGNGPNKTIRSSEIQIPLNQTLVTITLRGFDSEQAEIDFANKLGIDKLKVALGD